MPVSAEVSSITDRARCFVTPVGVVTPRDESRGAQAAAARVDSVSQPKIYGLPIFEFSISVFGHVSLPKCMYISIYHRRISWVRPKLPKASAHQFWSESVANYNIQVLEAPRVYILFVKGLGLEQVFSRVRWADMSFTGSRMRFSHELYDVLTKTVPCRWSGSEITGIGAQTSLVRVLRFRCKLSR